MAQQFVVTAAELDKLIEGLELEKLRLKDGSRSISTDDMHRTFHFHVVRWVQDVAGYKGSR